VFTVIVRSGVAAPSPVNGAVGFAVEAGGRELASGELLAGSHLGDETGRLINVRWAQGQAEAARAVIGAAVASAGPGAELHLTANAEVDDWLDDRLALFESCGFTLWQEKEGFWWADGGQDLPAPQGVIVRTLAEIGRERFAGVIAACTAGTLDRVDADAIGSMGGGAWAAALMSDAARPGEEDSWLVIENAGGDAAGYVAVCAFGPDTGTIVHIGVAGGHRGHGYIDQLLRLANRAARARGWTGMLSDVDVENTPMLAAMARNGHQAGSRPWHRWMYRHVTARA
jgi:GNAT superfamily N-acetyltransferase